MKIEHFALNVSEPVAMSKWYEEHLGLKIVSQLNDSPFTTFMADDSGRVMVEIYNNPKASIPEYTKMHPLILHLAFVSNNPDADKKRLLKSGALLISDETLEDGSHLIMLRDPWGICIQLCKRSNSLLSEEVK